MKAIIGHVSESGRLSLPADFRKAVGLGRGGSVVIELDGGEIRNPHRPRGGRPRPSADPRAARRQACGDGRCVPRRSEPESRKGMALEVLDAPALLALLLVEPGHERVQEVLADAAMTAVNLGEGCRTPRSKRWSGSGYPTYPGAPALRIVPVRQGVLAYMFGLPFPATQPPGSRLATVPASPWPGNSASKALPQTAPGRASRRRIGVNVELIR